MTDKPDGKLWGLWKWTVIIVASLALYVLSCGPAAWLSAKLDPDQDRWPSTIINGIYWPVSSLCAATGKDRVLFRYANWFIRDPEINDLLDANDSLSAKK
jgi:hypothetical protein